MGVYDVIVVIILLLCVPLLIYFFVYCHFNRTKTQVIGQPYKHGFCAGTIYGLLITILCGLGLNNLSDAGGEGAWGAMVMFGGLGISSLVLFPFIGMLISLMFSLIYNQTEEYKDNKPLIIENAEIVENEDGSFTVSGRTFAQKEDAEAFIDFMTT